MFAEIVLLLLRSVGSDSLKAGGGVVGQISTVNVTATTVSLVASDAFGGLTPYTYQWFLIDQEVGNDIPGAGVEVGDDDLTLDHAGLTEFTKYWWRIRYTDSEQNVVWSDLYQQDTNGELAVGLSYFWLSYLRPSQ